MNLLVRIRSPVALSCLALAACHPGRPVVATADAAVPSLWQIEVQGAEGGSKVDICADEAVRRSFVRPEPTVHGRSCRRIGSPADTGVFYAIRCSVDGQPYRVAATAHGDLKNDFTVDMAVTRQDVKGPSYEQTRRYRRLGACPAGWKIGDSAAPGATVVVNTLSGEQHRAIAAPG